MEGKNLQQVCIYIEKDKSSELPNPLERTLKRYWRRWKMIKILLNGREKMACKGEELAQLKEKNFSLKIWNYKTIPSTSPFSSKVHERGGCYVCLTDMEEIGKPCGCMGHCPFHVSYCWWILQDPFSWIVPPTMRV